MTPVGRACGCYRPFPLPRIHWTGCGTRCPSVANCEGRSGRLNYHARPPHHSPRPARGFARHEVRATSNPAERREAADAHRLAPESPHSLAARSDRTCSRDARTSSGYSPFSARNPRFRTCVSEIDSASMQLRRYASSSNRDSPAASSRPTAVPYADSATAIAEHVSASDQLAIMNARSMRSRAWVDSSRPRSA